MRLPCPLAVFVGQPVPPPRLQQCRRGSSCPTVAGAAALSAAAAALLE